MSLSKLQAHKMPPKNAIFDETLQVEKIGIFESPLKLSFDDIIPLKTL